VVVVVGEVFGCKAVSFVQCPRFVYSPEVFHMEPENHLLEKGIPNLDTHHFQVPAVQLFGVYRFLDG